MLCQTSMHLEVVCNVHGHIMAFRRSVSKRTIAKVDGKLAIYSLRPLLTQREVRSSSKIESLPTSSAIGVRNRAQTGQNFETRRQGMHNAADQNAAPLGLCHDSTEQLPSTVHLSPRPMPPPTPRKVHTSTGKLVKRLRTDILPAPPSTIQAPTNHPTSERSCH